MKFKNLLTWRNAPACIHSAQKGTTRKTGEGRDENGKFIIQQAQCRKCNQTFTRQIYPDVLKDIFSIPRKSPKNTP